MRTRSLRTSPWTHLTLLALAGVAASAARLAAAFHARRPDDGWGIPLQAAALHAVSDLGLYLPIAAGIAVAGVAFARGGVRTAATIAGGTLAALLLLDVAVFPAVAEARYQAARRAGASWPMSMDASEQRSVLSRRGVVRTALAFATGEVRGVDETLTSYPQTHPRLVAVQAIVEAGMLLTPLITVGLIVGVGAWVRRRVIFRNARDEVIARRTIAWVLVPAAMAVLGSWTASYGFEALFRREPLWTGVIPFAPFLVMAAVAWWAGARAARSAPSHLAYPEPDAAAR